MSDFRMSRFPIGNYLLSNGNQTDIFKWKTKME